MRPNLLLATKSVMIALTGIVESSDIILSSLLYDQCLPRWDPTNSNLLYFLRQQPLEGVKNNANTPQRALTMRFAHKNRPESKPLFLQHF